MGLLDDCKLLFGTTDLYKVLNISRDACNSTIKQTYRRLSLKIHPDRVCSAEKDNATKKFQVLSKACHILLDKDLRTIYDEDGEVSGEYIENGVDIKDWSQYWSSLFKLNIDDMKKFEETYRFSEMEAEDLKATYIQCKGDMDRIFEMQICCKIEDEERFRTILQESINKNEIPSFEIFTNEPKSKQRKRKKFYDREKMEAETELKKRKLDNLNSENDLEKLILVRQKNRKKEIDSFLNNLEAKYSKPNKKKSLNKDKKKKHLF